jgi:hypothetical protein
MTGGRRGLPAEPSRVRRGHQTIVRADREIIVQSQQHARARQQPLDKYDRLQPDPRQMVKVHHFRAKGGQQFSHRRHERPRLAVAEHETIEWTHPQKHFVGAAPDGLDPGSWPRWPVQRTDAAQKHGLAAGHVAHGAEQVVSDGLGPARNNLGMTVADVEDPGHLQAALFAGIEPSRVPTW